jgi:hypothetical protein
MLSWIWYSIANVILAGRQISTEPPFSLCLFQAGLIYASPVLWVSSFCSLTTTNILSLKYLCNRSSLHCRGIKASAKIVAAPYIFLPALPSIVLSDTWFANSKIKTRTCMWIGLSCKKCVWSSIKLIALPLFLNLTVFLEVLIVRDTRLCNGFISRTLQHSMGWITNPVSVSTRHVSTVTSKQTSSTNFYPSSFSFF